MKRILLFVAFGLCLSSAVWSQSKPSKTAAAFTAGNLVALRIGDATALSNAAAPVFLDEYTPTGAFIQSVALPTADGGSNQTLTMSGSSTSDGALNLSPNGQYLTIAGYDTSVGFVSVATTAGISRTIGRISADGTINTTTRITDGYTTNNIRSAVTDDGLRFWTGGAGATGSGGTRFVNLGATTSTQISTTVTNTRAVNIFGGQLYTSAQSGGFIGINTVGAGLPTTSGQTTAVTFNIASGNPYGYALLDRDAGVAGVDVAYVADQTGGLLKYSFDGTTWTPRGSLTGMLTGLTAVINGSNVDIYVTSGTAANNAIYKFTDNAAFNATITGSSTALTTSGALLASTGSTNRVFRGIAFAPVATTVGTPTGVVLANGTTTQSLTWTTGTNGSGTMVLYRTDATPIQAPSGNPTSYTPETGTTKVYADVGTSTTATSLTANTLYNYALYSADATFNYSPVAAAASGTTLASTSGTEAIDATFTGLLGFSGINVQFTTAAGATNLIQFTRNDNIPFTGTPAGNLPINGVTTSGGPINVSNVSTERWWNVAYSGGGTYNIALSVNGLVNGVSNKSTLAVLKRPSAGGDWSAFTTTYNSGFQLLAVTGLSGFSQFAIGGGSDNTLPVTLKSFTASSTVSDISLRWETGSEVNSRGFRIERKNGSDGNFNPLASFEDAPSLVSQGNVSSGAVYNFVDNDPVLAQNIVYFYRLSEEDLSGNRAVIGNVQEVRLQSPAVAVPVPSKYLLHQNYPNLFNPSTVFWFDLPQSGKVKLEIYNVLGSKMATVADGFYAAGEQRVGWTATGVPSGTYFYRITTPAYTKTLRLTLVK